MQKFNIYQLNSSGIGKTFLTSVVYDKSFTAQEVKERLVKKDFDPKIIVRKYS